MSVVSVTHDVQTRVGELHSASNAVSATYGYTKSADSTFTVGIAAGTSSYSANGSVSVSNSTGATANVTKSGAYRQYIDAHYDYTNFKLTYATQCGYTYLVEATAWDSDVYPGQNQASANPYGSCKADPHGYSNLPQGGDWSADRGTATSYDATATVFAFTFGGHTGYSTNNHISYTNTGPQTYLCGDDAAPASAGIVYNSGS